MPHLMIEHVRRRATGRGRLDADRRGAALLQFALVAPVLMLFIIGTIEIAIVLLVSGSIEASALAASRFGTTGATGSQVTRLDTIKQMIADNTYGLVDMSKVQIDVEVYPSFAAIGQPEPFTDTNHNGVHDPGEAYTDVNGNGKWDAARAAPDRQRRRHRALQDHLPDQGHHRPDAAHPRHHHPHRDRRGAERALPRARALPARAGPRALLADRRGVGAVELALVAPVLLLLLVGLGEVGTYVLLNLKLQHAATALADLATRDGSLTATQLDDLFQAAPQITTPFALGSNAVAIVTSVGADNGSGPTVEWQRRVRARWPRPATSAPRSAARRPCRAACCCATARRSSRPRSSTATSTGCSAWCPTPRCAARPTTARGSAACGRSG